MRSDESLVTLELRAAALSRRDVRRGLVGAGAMMALPPSTVQQAAAHKAGGLPGTIAEAAELVHTKKLGVTELTTACLECAKQLAPTLNTFITLTEEHALATAAALDSNKKAKGTRGPLYGIPVVSKDNFDTAGILTTMGSQFYEDRVATGNAEAVRKLHEAGTVMLGKANMNEFAAGVAGLNAF